MAILLTHPILTRGRCIHLSARRLEGSRADICIYIYEALKMAYDTNKRNCQIFGSTSSFFRTKKLIT